MNIKFLLTAAIALSLSACQSQEKHDHTHDQATTTTAGATEEHAHTGKELVLNNGAKWQSDESTRQHAAALQGIADGFPFNEGTSMEDYQKHAAAMQTELDYLIQDCRMKGPEHDALHLWLEPVLADTRALSETGDTKAAAAATSKLHEDIRKFPQYFD